MCLFTRGMPVDVGTGARLRGRSWPGAVIADGIVEKIFVEGGGVTQDSGPDPFEVSDADTMLAYLTKTDG